VPIVISGSRPVNESGASIPELRAGMPAETSAAPYRASTPAATRAIRVRVIVTAGQ